MYSDWNWQGDPGMPVVVELEGGGSPLLFVVADHAETAILLVRGYRFPRLEAQRWDPHPDEAIPADDLSNARVKR